MSYFRTDDLKTVLAKLDKLDQFEIREQLNRLRVENQKDDFYQMKLQLEKEILEEILKVEDEDLVNSERLNEIKKLLNDKAKGYNCALTGCRFIGDNHRQYVKHIKINHPRMSSIPCKFRHSCVRNFGNIDTLIKHIKEEHSAVINTPGQASTNRSAGAAADIPCKCNLISCGSKQFSKVKELVKHFNNEHLRPRSLDSTVPVSFDSAGGWGVRDYKYK